MGLKFTWGKLSVTLRSICMYRDNVYLTPNDVIATKCNAKAIQGVNQTTTLAGLTNNPGNCYFGCRKIKFWVMIYFSKGMKPEPETTVYVDIKTPKMIEANMTKH